MKRKKILIVDDEKDFTDMIKLNLEATGLFEVRAQNKGSMAVETVKEFKPDLILLDIIMPDSDGGDICFQLRADEKTRYIPVVFLTAVVTDREVNQYDSFIGGHPFIAKPVTVAKLIECIKKNIM